jgi:hypothetical protein
VILVTQILNEKTYQIIGNRRIFSLVWSAGCILEICELFFNKESVAKVVTKANHYA